MIFLDTNFSGLKQETWSVPIPKSYSTVVGFAQNLPYKVKK